MDLNEPKALDSHTVQVPMTKPYGSFLDQLAFWYYLYIIPNGFNPKKSKPNGPEHSRTRAYPLGSAACSPGIQLLATRASLHRHADHHHFSDTSLSRTP